MSKKVRVRSIFDLGRVPITPVNDEGRPSLRKFTEQYNREQQEIAARQKAEADRPLREAEAEFSRNLVKLRKAQAENLFINPSEELAAITSHVPDEVEGTVEHIRTQIREAFDALKRDLSSQGISLNPSGIHKIQAVSSRNPTIDIRLASNVRKIYDFMQDLNVFTSEDVTVPQPVVTQPVVDSSAESTPDLSELERLDLGSRSGSIRAKELCDSHYYSVEAAAVYQKWTSWLYETFHYVLTPDAKKAAIQFFQDTNSSYLDPKAWERARRNLVRRGLMPRTCLTSEEVLAEEVEQTTERLDTFHARQELNRKLSQFGQKLLQ